MAAARGAPVSCRARSTCRCIGGWIAAFWNTPPTSFATARFRNLADGLKPVQRRILWALHEKDDGRFIKVANVAGDTMKYHPHGNASIGDALVVLTNKRYLIEGQGNFGNIFTGDPAAAPRYIECRLTEAGARANFSTTRSPSSFRATTDATRSRSPCRASCPLLLDAGHRRHRGRHVLAHPAAQFPRAARGADRHSQKAAVQVPAGFPDRRPDGRARVRGRHRPDQGPREDQSQGRVHRRHQGDSADHHDRFADRLDRRRVAQRQDQGQERQRFHLRGGRDRNQSAAAA